ncbi:MFS transporter [Pseudonocardia sp. RS010]|uniref:MFS transporter n=1 Tax=Pseudonocardia sp. RS010 TaxID=3385979 RepID=UPI00399F3EAC
MHPDSTAALPELARRRWYVIVPLLGLAMFMLNLDRTNISLLLAPLAKDLGLSLSDVGLVSSILFIGSVVFQVPLVLLVQRFGGRWLLGACLVIWGAASALGGLANTEGTLLAARFVVGIGESAFHPLMYVLLARWFLERERGRANTRFFVFSFAASVLTAPVTGFMLEYMTWRWVLIWQGVPAAVLGVLWVLFYNDSPSRVFWLRRERGVQIEQQLAAERSRNPIAQQVSFRRALLNRRILALMLIYGMIGGGGSAIPLWLPTVVRTFSAGNSSLVVGLLSGLPFLVGAIVGTLLGMAADRTGRFRALMLIPLTIGSLALLAGPLAAGHAALQLALLCVVVAGCQSAVPIFYAFPSWMVAASVLTVGMGIINMTGTLFAFFATFLVGWVGELTTPAIGFATLGIIAGIGAIVGAVVLRDPPSTRRPAASEPIADVATGTVPTT